MSRLQLQHMPVTQCVHKSHGLLFSFFLTINKSMRLVHAVQSDERPYQFSGIVFLHPVGIGKTVANSEVRNKISA